MAEGSAGDELRSKAVSVPILTTNTGFLKFLKDIILRAGYERSSPQTP